MKKAADSRIFLEYLSKMVLSFMNLLEGFYAIYMASRDGEALAVITIDNRMIRGAGLDGTCFDGSFKLLADGLEVSLHVSVPAEMNLIQGGTSGSHGVDFDLSFPLPLDFAQRDFIKIETPHGLVNARFRRLRGLK